MENSTKNIAKSTKKKHFYGIVITIPYFDKVILCDKMQIGTLSINCKFHAYRSMWSYMSCIKYL